MLGRMTTSPTSSPSPNARQQFHPRQAEQLAFVQNLLAHPDDNDARLVFADWLEEHGEHDKAELLRLGVAIQDPANWPRFKPMRQRQRELREQVDIRWQVLVNDLRWGDVFPGTIVRVDERSADADLNGLPGPVLLLSTSRFVPMTNLFHVGQREQFVIVGVSPEEGEIAVARAPDNSLWDEIPTRYIIGSRHRGEVVNLMTYGAWVRLERGVEGLVHISEMYWTKRINDPSEVLHVGEMVDVQVIDLNPFKQEIRLSIRQTQPNPWLAVAERFPPGTALTLTVRKVSSYGLWFDAEEGLEALLHVNQMPSLRPARSPQEFFRVGDAVRVVVDSVNVERRRLDLREAEAAGERG